MLRALLLDIGQVLVEDDALLARERDEALAAGAADERQPGLAGELDAPGGEARARDQDRDAHAHGLDHHLGGQAAGGVEDLVAAALALAEHPAGDLVDGVVAADVLHVDERPVLAGEHAAVDGAGLEIERGRGVDGVGEPVEPRGLERRLRQRDGVERLHEVAEGGALRAAARLGAPLQLVLEVGLALGAHDDDGEVLVVVDRRHHVVGLEHVLVEEIAEREVLRVVADRHHGDDLLRVEVERQRALDDHPGLDPLAALVDAGDPLGQARVVRVRADEKAGAMLVHGRSVAQGPGFILERDDFSSSRHPALPLCLSMIFSENRSPLFGIMPLGGTPCRIGKPALAARSGAPRRRGRRRLGVAVARAAHRLRVLLVGRVAVDHHPPQEQDLREILPVGAEAGRAVAALAGPGPAAGGLRTEARRADGGEHVADEGHAVRRNVERIIRLDEVGKLRPPAPPLLVFLLRVEGGVEP